MDHAGDDAGHVAAVAAWLERANARSTPGEELRLFHAAFEAVWARAVTTLGSVTLTAIAERVLSTATDEHGFLAAIDPRPSGDAGWQAKLYDRLEQVPQLELVAGMRFGLVELLTVIGTLTAEILSAELHAALASVGTSSSTTATSTPASPTVVGTKAAS